MIVQTKSDVNYVQHNFIQIKNKLLGKTNEAESHFLGLLLKANIYFVREKCNFRTGTRWCYYDYYLPFHRIYIEIDGGSHDTAEQKAIDAEKDRIVRNKCRFIVRLTVKEVLELKEITLEYIIKKLCYQETDFRISQRQNKKRRKLFTPEKYYKNLVGNTIKGVNDMLEDTGLKINRHRNIYVYDSTYDKFFKFRNMCFVKLSLQRTLSDLVEMKNNIGTQNKMRRYVISESWKECRDVANKVYGRVSDEAKIHSCCTLAEVYNICMTGKIAII